MNRQESIVIDGSYGEGGGQILRTSLSLASITGKALKLVNIREGRKKPGLRPQHLTAVQACASVCGAKLEDAELGARKLTFVPGAIAPGSYEFHIGTAGAATLVLQTILPLLSMAKGESSLLVSGGTHVPWSPPYHHFAQVLLPTINQLGFRCKAQIKHWGWYPKGGGVIEARVKPYSPLGWLNLDQPFHLKSLSGISASSRLPEHIRVRQKKQVEARLDKAGIQGEIELLDVDARNPGTLLFLCLQGKDSLAGFSSLGARGKRAELVADEAADDLFVFLETGAALDHYLADQLLVYLANAPGKHKFTTSKVTQHLLTNAWVIEKFLPVKFEIDGGLGDPGRVVKRDV
ncbi:MAG: RNA 3'-phosphate cyclase [Deltaproteobacteria bacterium]|nr:RNA 3'-phosphate cyclase [Deltaproteobacteria bacterium]